MREGRKEGRKEGTAIGFEFEVHLRDSCGERDVFKFFFFKRSCCFSFVLFVNGRGKLAVRSFVRMYLDISSKC